MVRLGVAGMMPPDVQAVTSAQAARIRAVGFTGASCFLTDPLVAEEAALRRAAAVLRDAGVAPAQANARYERLCDDDEDLRALGIRQASAAVRCAAWLGAATLYLRPGSLNRRGHWTPHPQNTAPATLARLIDSLRRVAAVAELEGVTLALEGHTVSPLDSPERLAWALDQVGSRTLGFNADPVNFVAGIVDAYDTQALLLRLFRTLGARTVAGHAKDVRVEDRLVVHVAECAPGEGLLDHLTFLQQFASACPHGWLLIEHLPDERIPAAKQALDRYAAAAGIYWEE